MSEHFIYCVMLCLSIAIDLATQGIIVFQLYSKKKLQSRKHQV